MDIMVTMVITGYYYMDINQSLSDRNVTIAGRIVALKVDNHPLSNFKCLVVCGNNIH